MTSLQPRITLKIKLVQPWTGVAGQVFVGSWRRATRTARGCMIADTAGASPDGEVEYRRYAQYHRNSDRGGERCLDIRNAAIRHASDRR
jgi:hypothetical protein